MNPGYLCVIYFCSLLNVILFTTVGDTTFHLSAAASQLNIIHWCLPKAPSD